MQVPKMTAKSSGCIYILQYPLGHKVNLISYISHAAELLCMTRKTSVDNSPLLQCADLTVAGKL